MRALVVVLALLVFAGAAVASPADIAASKLTIVAGDIAGSTQKSQGPIHEKGYTSGYQRSFAFGTPNGRSGLVFFQSEALVAQTVARAANDVTSVRSALNTPGGRAAFVASIAANLKVKPSMVKPGTLRSVHVGDSSVELPLAVQLPKRRIYESLVYMQRDRVVSVIVSASLRPTAAADSKRLASAAGGHVDAALAPALFAKPAVDGLPQVGELLTASPGTWSDATAKVTYQWQRCDASGASCSDISGAAGTSYTAAPADAGSTIRVEVSAANRFGTTKGDSAVTGVVAEPPPPPAAQISLRR
jgi:hypothetical protein